MRQVRLAYAAIAVGVALVAGGAVGLFWPTISYEVANFLGFCDENVERAPLAVCFRDELDFDSLNSLYKELALSYDGALDREKLLEGAKHGLVAAVGDPYTVFMSRTEATEYRKQLSGDIGYGVGVEIGVRGGKVVVLRVIDDNPAARAGVKAGDILKKVGDKEVTGMTSAEAADLIRGANGSSVEITVERAGATKEFTLKREKINNPSVLLSYDGGIAVMRLSRFDQDTARLFAEKVRELKGAGATGLVLDLRGNGGGFVDAALGVAGLWLDHELVMTEKAQFKSTELRSPRGQVQLDGFPTVILIDGGTASASEIVAGALQHYGRATLVGTESYGKGSVQKMLDLSAGEMLKVTIARWLLPSGLNLAEDGLSPDQTVELTIEDLEAMRDPQLEAAKARLRS